MIILSTRTQTKGSRNITYTALLQQTTATKDKNVYFERKFFLSYFRVGKMKAQVLKAFGSIKCDVVSVFSKKDIF